MIDIQLRSAWRLQVQAVAVATILKDRVQDLIYFARDLLADCGSRFPPR
jgi:hypothetical protein